MTDTVIWALIFRHPIKDTSDLFWRPFLTGKPDIYFRQHALPFSNQKDTVTRMKKKNIHGISDNACDWLPHYSVVVVLVCVYFRHGLEAQGKVLSIESKFFFFLKKTRVRI